MVRVLVIIFAAFFCGCATTERTVYDNILTSEYPPMKIKIDDEFFYLGNPSGGVSGKSLDNFDLRGGRDSYLFAIPAKGAAQRILSIEYRWTQGYYAGRLYDDVNAIKKEDITLNGKNYESFVSSIMPTKGSYLTEFAASRGITFTAGILKVYGRVCGANGNTLINIMYYEPLKGNNLVDFENRADKSFEIIE